MFGASIPALATENAAGTDSAADVGANADPVADNTAADSADGADSLSTVDPADGTADPTDPADTVDAITDAVSNETENSLETLARTPAYESVLAPGTYYIRPAISHTRFLDVAGGSTANRANIQLWLSNTTPAQRFVVSIDEKGYYTLASESSSSKRVLDVAGGAAKAGTNVQQYDKNDTDAQKWSIKDNVDGSFTLVSALDPALVLDVASAQNINGANIQIYKANNTPAQNFYFIPIDPKVTSERTVDDGTYTIASTLAGSFVLDIPGASDNTRTIPQLYQQNDTAAQMFDIRLQEDGFYLIRSMCSGLALDVAGAGRTATTAIQQYTQNGTAAQRWAIRENTDGTVTFISKVSGLAADIPGGRAASKTPLQQYYPNDTAAQSFRLIPVTSEPLTEGYMNIVPYAKTSTCIDIASASRAAGANAQAYTPNNTAAQKFEVLRIAPAVYAFRALASGLYLTQDGSNVCQQPAPQDDPAATQQWQAKRVPGGMTLTNLSSSQAMTFVANDIRVAAPKDNTAAQIFRFNPTTLLEPGYYIVSAATGFVLDVKNGSSTAGANVQLYTKNNTGAQKWKVTRGTDGYYTFANAASNKVLDIAKGSNDEGANVQQWDANNTAAQKWKPVPTGDGWFYLQAKNGTFLTAAGAGNYNGANVFISTTSTTSKAQKFSFIATTYTPPVQYSGTYADVNLTTQKMFFVKNGVKVLETDIVTGAPSMATPPGTFRVQGKSSPAVLVGPGYRSPVTYWMAFNGGIGFHDATWQSSFGGKRYLTNGSHGCINMPLAAAKTLYSYLSVGDTVRVHY
jgi:lipoprotein-anchoring transpeptidase ErfK/SrfK